MTRKTTTITEEFDNEGTLRSRIEKYACVKLPDDRTEPSGATLRLANHKCAICGSDEVVLAELATVPPLAKGGICANDEMWKSISDAVKEFRPNGENDHA